MTAEIQTLKKTYSILHISIYLLPGILFILVLSSYFELVNDENSSSDISIDDFLNHISSHDDEQNNAELKHSIAHHHEDKDSTHNHDHFLTNDLFANNANLNTIIRNTSWYHLNHQNHLPDEELFSKSYSLRELKTRLKSYEKCPTDKICPYSGKNIPKFDERQVLNPIGPSYSMHKHWGSNNHNGNYLSERKVFHDNVTEAEEKILLEEGEEYVEKFWEDQKNGSEDGKRTFEVLTKLRVGFC